MLGFGLPGGMEWIIIAMVGLLIFGKRLPSIARSVGSSIIEFKKGVKGAKDGLKELENDVKIDVGSENDGVRGEQVG